MTTQKPTFQQAEPRDGGVFIPEDAFRNICDALGIMQEIVEATYHHDEQTGRRTKLECPLNGADFVDRIQAAETLFNLAYRHVEDFPYPETGLCTTPKSPS